MLPAINILFSVLFVASTAVNIYVSLRITKAESEMKDYINKRIKEETLDLITRRELLREIEHLQNQIDKINM
jgi:hypothetical protein